MSATARKRLDTIYVVEVADWKRAWGLFEETWFRMWDEYAIEDLTVEQIERFDEQEDVWRAAMPPLVEAWQHSVNWYATPEENAAWQQFDQGCEAFLSPYLEAEENGETDLGVWPSDIPAAPDEHEGEGALWEIARREVASGPEQDIRRRIASAVLFRLFLARLARRFARANRRVHA